MAVVSLVAVAAQVRFGGSWLATCLAAEVVAEAGEDFPAEVIAAVEAAASVALVAEALAAAAPAAAGDCK